MVDILPCFVKWNTYVDNGNSMNLYQFSNLFFEFVLTIFNISLGMLNFKILGSVYLIKLTYFTSPTYLSCNQHTFMSKQTQVHLSNIPTHALERILSIH